MKRYDAEILVKGASAALAADAVALGLMAAGASVDFPDRSNAPATDDRTLRGGHVGVRILADGHDLAAGPQAAREPSMVSAARVAVGAVLLLALFGAEVRLHFGPRLDTILTLAVLAAFWWRVRKRAPLPT